MAIFDKILDRETKQYKDSNINISNDEDKARRALAHEIKAAIDSGEINSWDNGRLINAYFGLVGSSLNPKKATKIKVRLIKTNKKTLVNMLETAIKLTYKDIVADESAENNTEENSEADSNKSID